MKEFNISSLIGLSEEKAKKIVEDHGYFWRVTLRNGHPLIGTADYRTDRINLHIMNAIVTEVSIG